MAKKGNKEIVTLSLDPEILHDIDLFSKKWGFTRSAALEFIFKNMVSESGARSMVCEMITEARRS